MKHTLYILCCLLCLGLSVKAQSPEEEKEKLLRSLSEAPHDSTRLVILEKLTQLTKYEPKTRLHYIDLMIKEAEKQKNDYYKCTAYLYTMYVLYNEYDIKNLREEYKKLEPLARKNKFYDLLFQGQRCIIDFYLLTSEYEKQEQEALAMLNEAQKVKSQIGICSAYICLGNVYTGTYRGQMALKAYEKAYDIAIAIKDNMSTLEILTSLINNAQATKDMEAWYKYIKLEETFVNQNIRPNVKEQQEFDSAALMMYIHALTYYSTIKDKKEASICYELATKYYTKAKMANVYKELYMGSSMLYFYKFNMLDKALQQVDSLLKLQEDISPILRNYYLFMRAGIIHDQGKSAEALPLFRTYTIRRDTLQVKILNIQSEQVNNIHNLNVLQLKKEQKSQYIQYTLLLILIIPCLYIIGALYYTYKARRKLQHDESEMRQMTHEVELANVAKDRFLSNISAAISVPLNVVVDGSLLLASGKEVEEKKRLEISEAIGKTSADLMRLVNDILDLSRLEAGMMRFVLSDVEVFTMLHDAAGISLMKDSSKVEIIHPESALFWTHIDGSRLATVFNSFFLYPSTDDIKIKATLNGKGNELTVRINGTALASHNPSQELIIRNEINRMIIVHFGGRYEVQATEQENYIELTVRGNLQKVE